MDMFIIAFSVLSAAFAAMAIDKYAPALRVEDEGDSWADAD